MRQVLRLHLCSPCRVATRGICVSHDVVELRARMMNIIGLFFPFSKHKIMTLNYSFFERQISDRPAQLLKFNFFCFKWTLSRTPGCNGFALAEGVGGGGCCWWETAEGGGMMGRGTRVVRIVWRIWGGGQGRAGLAFGASNTWSR